ncbi:uncharacterized protein LOC129584859 [Paramacrobiotus metropolitanus]|uniref:uncharacterized protein LOC129584859 n=1 Tax=Paramacrobiotus metropolitanus TaxID=2943436 RepID=UPI00244575EC|nr:uncharacterized protein LOC129584859 [Paramacrobiotus metropolitanus]
MSSASQSVSQTVYSRASQFISALDLSGARCTFCKKMSTLPRSTGSFKKLRVVRLVTQLFRRRRRKSAKEPRTPFISISSPTPILTNFSTMSLIIHCRHLSRSGDLDYSIASSPTCELVMSGSVFADDDKSTSYCEGDLNEADSVGLRSVSHDSVFQPDNFRSGKMLRSSSRPSSRNYGKTGNGTASSSLVDVSDGAVRAELENKIFIRAKRMNSGTNDPTVSVQRSRANTSPMPMDVNSLMTPTGHEQGRSRVDWSGSVDADLDQRAKVEHASYFTLETGTQLSYRKLPSLDVQPTLSLTLPVAYATQTLSNDAARHRIAVKPKNRRPKSYQSKLEVEVAPKPVARFRDYAPATDNVTVPNYANNTTTSEALTAELATVLSEVEATYELFNIPAPTPLEPPQPAVRRSSATMTYSKSFHIPRRPAENAHTTTIALSTSPAVKSFVSPRLTRTMAIDPPPIPPKTFRANDNEFLQVLTKFRKHIEPNQQSDEAGSSGTPPSTSLISQPSSLRKNTFNLVQVQDNARLPKETLDPFTTNHRTAASKTVSSSDNGVVTELIVSKLPLPLTHIPAVQEVFQENTALPVVPVNLADSDNRSTDDGSSKVIPLQPVDPSVHKLVSPGPPIISPKPRLRLKLNAVRVDNGEKELMKVLAKRNSDMELTNTLSAVNTETGCTKSSSDTVKRAPSFREMEIGSPSGINFRRTLQPELISNYSTAKDNDAADKENQPVERSQPIPAKRQSQAEVTAELRRSFFSGDKIGDTKLLREKSTGSAKSSFDKEDVPVLTVASTLRKVSLETKDSTVNSTGAEWGSLLRKVSIDKSGEGTSNASTTNSLHRHSLKSASYTEGTVDAPVFPVTLKKVPSIKRKEDSSSTKNNSTSGSVFTEKTAVVSHRESVTTPREDEPPDSGRSSVISRAALFQSKVDTGKPISPRFDANKNISARTVPVPKSRALAQPFSVTVVPNENSAVETVMPKAATFSGAQLQATMWSAPVTVPALKPVIPAKTVKAVAQPVSCGSAMGGSEVPSWVILAQEKRKRLNTSMLTDSSELAKMNNSGLSSKEMQIVNASFA